MVQALMKPYASQRPQGEVILHTDLGSQYTSKEFRDLTSTLNLRQSFSRKGYPYNNTCIESFHSVIKKEWIFHEKYRTRAQAESSILEYILHFYNCKRVHGTIGYKTPIAYEKKYYKQKKTS